MQRPEAVFHSDPDDSTETVDEQGMSLEELGQTYARMLGNSSTPTSDRPDHDEGILEHDSESNCEAIAVEAAESDACPVTPRSIVEAVLFVGHPDNKPISPDAITSLMRGVGVADIDQAVDELNAIYRTLGHAMEIVSVGGGYRMQLSADLNRVRDSMYGKVKDARLNQSAIDCLSLVAYQPGITREELDKQWHRPSKSVLSMLVRRSLLELRREGKGNQAIVRYYPTDRFLNLFGLVSLDELPQVQDFD